MKGFKIQILLFWVGIWFFSTSFIQAQDHNKVAMKLIAENRIEQADDFIRSKIDSLLKIKAYQGVPQYMYPLGAVSMLKDSVTTFPKVLEVHNTLITQAPERVIYHSHIAMASLYNDQGKAASAYKNAELAAKIAKRLTQPELLLESSFYQAEYGMKQGNYELLFTHTDEAVAILKKFPNKTFPLAPRVYNYKGSISYFTSKSDSANYYFKKALSGIKDMEPTPENTYYLPGTINGNWFLVKQSEGNYEEAMALSLEGVRLFQTFLSKTNNHPLKSRVNGNLSISFRNLGSLYYDLGDKEKALKFAKIGYDHAKKNFLPNTAQNHNAVIMMAEANLFRNNLEEAFKYLKEAEQVLQHIEGDSYNWYAQYYRILGDAYFKSRQFEKAVSAYEKATDIYNEHNPRGLSQNQIYLKLGLAQGYAEIEYFSKAKQTALEIYNFTKENYGDNAYLTKAALLTLGRISFDAGDYKSAVEYADKGIQIIQKISDESPRNQAFFGIDYVDLLLLKEKAKYAQIEKDNVEGLKEIAGKLNAIIAIDEDKKPFKSIVNEGFNSSGVNTELFEFAKQVQLERYQLTHEGRFLNELIELHESSIYQRIRSRLNLKDIEVSDVPKTVLEKESALKSELKQLLDNTTIDETNVDALTQAIADWDVFLSDLKNKHSRYYKMRYASVKKSVKDFLSTEDHSKTLVRYFNIEDKLFVLVINGKDKTLLPIPHENLETLISTTLQFYNEEAVLLEAYDKLYQQLWKPIEHLVNTDHVIVYPHGALFNLSFELLTPKRANTFQELASASLLNKHSLSYNYSLFLLDKNRKTFDFENDFLAFAPEFSANMKANYKIAVKDSLELDNTYLKLLPQPFSVSLVEKISRKLKGKLYTNALASKQLFTNIKKEHKIIHIGTHAESDNLNPELSRLVFAKNVSDSTHINNNYLYAFEIYNQNLNSKLAVLTACDTGKPSYQPGEGMLSLAHAFNYAGSESILTSLWQIDEQSSAQILDYFYSYLEDGLTKDKALKQAKLQYLKMAKGRTIHPHYWAGLIIMGDTAPVDFSSSSNTVWWLIFTGILIIIGVRLFVKNRST